MNIEYSNTQLLFLHLFPIYVWGIELFVFSPWDSALGFCLSNKNREPVGRKQSEKE